MADRTENERKARLMLAGLANLTAQASSQHPIKAAKPTNETERVNQIILSNLADKDD